LTKRRISYGLEIQKMENKMESQKEEIHKKEKE
jgi:hypothetical protein